MRDGMAFVSVHDEEPQPLDEEQALEQLVERCVEEYLGRAGAEETLARNWGITSSSRSRVAGPCH